VAGGRRGLAETQQLEALVMITYHDAIDMASNRTATPLVTKSPCAQRLSNPYGLTSMMFPSIFVYQMRG
jgi:hypothetical protein